VVDAHVHHWDPARVDWYPYLASDDTFVDRGIDSIRAMRRLFDQPTYAREAGAWNVEKYVHVAAAAPAHALEESARLAALAAATGHPDAIIGGIDRDDDLTTTVSQLDAQMAIPQFRGVRSLKGLVWGAASCRDVLSCLQERELVFDLVVHPEEMADAAAALGRCDGLTVVVEHAGWPSAGSEESYRDWAEGMRRLAGTGARVHCKISGLPMHFHVIDAAAFRPWIEHCLEVFGEGRCLFGSNFPVDGLFGTFDGLMQAHLDALGGLDAGTLQRVFADNAEGVYRC
jgi:predicted TIM-barrel fold metal-dependent hydrolase